MRLHPPSTGAGSDDHTRRHRPPCPRARTRRRRARRSSLARPPPGGGPTPEASPSAPGSIGSRPVLCGASCGGSTRATSRSARFVPRVTRRRRWSSGWPTEAPRPPCAVRPLRPPQRAGLVDDHGSPPAARRSSRRRGAGDLLIGDDLERHGLPCCRYPCCNRRPGAGVDACCTRRRSPWSPAREPPATWPGRGSPRTTLEPLIADLVTGGVRIGKLHPTFLLHRAHSRKPANDHDDPLQLDPAVPRRRPLLSRRAHRPK